MKILFIGINYAPEQAGIAVYTSGLAEDFARRGDEVTVICAPPHFPQWRVQDGYSACLYQATTEKGVQVVRCPTYIPATTGAFKRIIHYLSFTISSLPAALRHARKTKPDIIFCIAPSLLSAATALAAALACSARTWLHIQDLEIDAALATGAMRHGPPMRLALAIERFLMRKFDRVSTISPQMAVRIAGKGVPPARLSEFRNWSDLDEIRPLERPSCFRQLWGVSEEHVALYSGSIGNKQGIEIIIGAARHLKDRRDLLFVICGEGPNRAHLEQLASDAPNVRFFDLQPRERLNELLGLASIHLLPQLADAADNVLPSKLTNMFASGRPVVATAAAGTGLFDAIQGCGVTSPPESVQSFAECIEALIDQPDTRERLGREARACAERTVDANRILETIHNSFLKMVRGPKISPSK